MVDAQDGLIDEGLVGAEVVLLLHVHHNRARVVRLLIRIRDHVLGHNVVRRQRLRAAQAAAESDGAVREVCDAVASHLTKH